jgi:hypothetical protein
VGRALPADCQEAIRQTGAPLATHPSDTLTNGFVHSGRQALAGQFGQFFHPAMGLPILDVQSASARAGKDVLCEKPLTLTADEGIILRRVIEETGSIFQTASENRSIDTCLRMCELVRNGVIGSLRHVRVSPPSGNEARGENFMKRDERPVPEGFNYDLWLGPAPVAPYVPARCHGSLGTSSESPACLESVRSPRGRACDINGG